METAVYIFLGGAVITLLGWLFIPRINRDVATARENRDAVITAAKQRDADTANWRSGFRGVVVHLRTEMVRGQIPSDWFPKFETSIPILSRVVATMPDGIDPEKRTEIVAIVDELCRMSAGDGGQAVHGEQKVLDMLQKLEELTNDAQ